MLETLKNSELHNAIELDLTLARGLNYYTGCIFEVKALDVQIGSITGGGRYDNLTGIFGLPGLSGVGISFGADRIYDVLTQLDLYPSETASGARVLFMNFGDKEAAHCLTLAARLRKAGIYGGLPRCRENEEANELCQCAASAFRSTGRRKRNGTGRGNAQGYAKGRTANG